MKNDAPHVSVEIEHYESGSVKWEIEWVRGMKHGRCRCWLESGTLLAEGYFHEGKAEGWFRDWRADGSLAQEFEMVDGLHHGQYRSWWSQGNLKEEGRWCRGLREVGYRWYRQDGSIWRILDRDEAENR